ncbi:galanin receptor type 1-like [Ptychodera flava]|uniref:galanin receptor type 1-like n=1 Tax=Ptychodera flava TaxID=63121 RepID=UPI00396A4256
MDSLDQLNSSFFEDENFDNGNDSTLRMNETLRFSPPGSPPLYILLPVTIVYCITFIVGLIGNVLVIFTVRRCKGIHGVTNSFLANLATADLILVAIVIPFQTPTYFSWKWVLGEFMCKALSYLTLLSSSCSVFMLTAMSIERYLAIVHPLMAQSVFTANKTRKVIILVWAVAMVFSFPPLYFKRQFSWDPPGHPTYHTCATSWPNDVLGKAYSLYLLIGMYLVPLFMMAYCYCGIVFKLNRGRFVTKGVHHKVTDGLESSDSTADGYHSVISCQSSSIQSSENVDTETRFEKRRARKRCREQDRKQVIIMLLVVVALFMLCWGPLIWLVFLIEFGFVSRYSHIRTYLAIAFNLLSYLNSCMNPICYSFISRSFRRSLFTVCRKCCQRARTHGSKRHSAAGTLTVVSSAHTQSSGTTKSPIAVSEEGEMYLQEDSLAIEQDVSKTATEKTRRIIHSEL